MKASRDSEWLCLDIEIPVARREILSEVLWKLETLGFQELEEGELLRVRAFFPGTIAADSLLPVFTDELAAAGGGEGSCSASTFEYNSEDGLEEYRKSFHGFAVGKSFFVYPSWSKPSPDHAFNILMEPSLAFGTGSHESTRLAVQALEAVVPKVNTMLDVGTGSGILSIAALKLQPDLSVTAFDIDLLAVRTAALNLSRNQLSSVQLFAGEAVSVGRRFDLVVANLALALFERLAEALLERCERHLILSGLLHEQAPGVIDLFGRHSSFAPVCIWQENEWICLHLES